MTFSDTFDRPNAATLGAGWRQPQGFGITDNAADGTGGNCYAWAVQPNHTDNHFAEIQWLAGPTASVACRGNGEVSNAQVTCYLARSIASGVRIEKVIQGQVTPLTTLHPYTKSPGDIISIDAVGEDIMVSINGVECLAVRDADIPSGKFSGIFSTSKQDRFGSFLSGDLADDPTVTPPIDIDQWGEINVSAQLNAFIEAQPSGTVISFNSNAVYRCDQTLKIFDKHDLTIRGNGALIFTDDPTGDESTLATPSRKARTRGNLLIDNSTTVNIDGLRIRGAHPNGGIEDPAYVSALEGQHGIDVNRSQDVTVKQCQITDVYGDFWYAGFDAAHVTFKNLYARRNGRQGFAITKATDILVEDCDLADIRRSSFDLEPNNINSRVERIVVRNNTFGMNKLTWFACGGKGFVGDVLVEGNTIHAPANIICNSADGTRRGPFTLLNNRSDVNVGNPLGAAWRFTDVDGVTAHGNSIQMQPGRNMHLVGTTNCTDVDVSGNEFPGGVGDLRPD